MPRPRYAMRKVREILRLTLGENMSRHQAAAALGIPRTTVRNCVTRAKEAGVSWPLPADLDDAALEALLYRHAETSVPRPQRPEADWEEVHRELRKKGVT